MRITHVILSCSLALLSKAVASPNDGVLVTTQFAVPVGVPVAPFAPTYYSYNATRPNANGVVLSQTQQDELVERITSNVVQQLKTAGTTDPQAAKPNKVESTTAQSVLQLRCVSCHNQENAKGKLALDLPLTGLSREVRQQALLRVLSTDVSRRMPKGQPPLSESEFLALFRELVR